MKVILDTNIWISFLFGKHIAVLKNVLENPGVEVFVSPNLINEIKSVSSRPKITQNISSERISLLLDVINDKCTLVSDFAEIPSTIRDENDIYLISLAESIPADYLVTGDKDLLVLIQTGKCKIITFRAFLDILGL